MAQKEKVLTASSIIKETPKRTAKLEASSYIRENVIKYFKV
jgi:hypothetical protein